MSLGRVLITGVAGFIGSNLAKSLLEDGWEVAGIDNLSQGTPLNIVDFKNHPNFRFFEANVQNAEAVIQAAKGCSTIYHLAAYKIPRYGNAYDTLTLNTRGTESAIEAAIQTDAHLVFSSTSDVYGRNPNLPFTEEHDLVLGSPDIRRWAYAISKAYCEQLLFAEKERRNLKFTCVRFFGGYGPNQALSWWGGPQSVFLELALDGKPLTVHGKGDQTRSFTFVVDHVNGLKACLKNEKALGEVINLGNDQEITILALAKKIWNLVHPGTEAKIELVPYQTFGKYTDVVRRVPDLKKARKILGYVPRWSLDSGLKITLDWQIDRRKRIREKGNAQAIAA